MEHTEIELIVAQFIRMLDDLKEEVYKIPQKAKDLIKDAELREEMAVQIREQMEAKKALQASCSHHHKWGQSHFAIIEQDWQVVYLLCQKCQAQITPDDARFSEWLAEAIEERKVAMQEYRNREPISEEEQKLYDMPWEEFKALGKETL